MSKGAPSNRVPGQLAKGGCTQAGLEASRDWGSVQFFVSLRHRGYVLECFLAFLSFQMLPLPLALPRKVLP
jgi:hypothetical protein